MVVSIVSPLVKRGVQAGVHCMHRMAPAFHNAGAVPGRLSAPAGKLPQEEILRRLKNPMAIITLALTGISFILAMTAIEYAIRIVALNLALVESDSGVGSIKLPLDGDSPADAKAPLLDDYDDAVPALPSKAARSEPITASIRSTMTHLKSVGGFFSRFRGASFGLFYGACYFIIYSLLSSVLVTFGPLGVFGSMMLTSAITCNLRAGWTHATIAAPSDKGFFQRFLPRETAKKLIGPNLRAQLSVGLTQFVTAFGIIIAHGTVQRYGLNWLSINVFLLPIATAISMGVFVILPCHIALIRREASLLPEDAGCIVPFDRSFNGTVTWEFDSCREKFFHMYSIRGAWKTLDKKILKRAVVLLAKLCAIFIAMNVFFSVLVGVELFVILGKSNVSWFAVQVHNSL
jgi:hypothetical protein